MELDEIKTQLQHGREYPANCLFAIICEDLRALEIIKSKKIILNIMEKCKVLKTIDERTEDIENIICFMHELLNILEIHPDAKVIHKMILRDILYLQNEQTQPNNFEMSIEESNYNGEILLALLAEEFIYLVDAFQQDENLDFHLNRLKKYIGYLCEIYRESKVLQKLQQNINDMCEACAEELALAIKIVVQNFIGLEKLCFTILIKEPNTQKWSCNLL